MKRNSLVEEEMFVIVKYLKQKGPKSKREIAEYMYGVEFCKIRSHWINKITRRLDRGEIRGYLVPIRPGYDPALSNESENTYLSGN